MSSSISSLAPLLTPDHQTLSRSLEDALESLAMIVQLNEHGRNKGALPPQDAEIIRSAITMVEWVYGHHVEQD